MLEKVSHFTVSHMFGCGNVDRDPLSTRLYCTAQQLHCNDLYEG